MAGRKLSNLEKEKLINEIQRYPVLFDERNPSYKDRRIVENSWKEILIECEFQGKFFITLNTKIMT